MSGMEVHEDCGIVEFLLRHGYTRTKSKQLLKHGAVFINGRAVARYDHRLSAGDTVAIGRGSREREDILSRFGIRVVYEDEYVIVIDKPQGMLTIATEKEKRMTAYFLLGEYMKERDPRGRIFIVHRLDRETSGLIVFAKTGSAKKGLQKDWKNAEKKYYAVVEGLPKSPEGKIESYLSETKSLRVYTDRSADETRHAITRYRMIRAGKAYSLLDIALETGRKHQIRVHLADIGCPVAGDKRYGASTNPIRRMALHAYSLSFRHPVTGKKFHFTSPTPEAFDPLLRQMRGTVIR
jgi:23S rRNA pseudouridine1911/1915/1917 synthase